MAGLRGINLSGGQRQRLNLARCAYFDGDLVLLDNALSAVDHHTAQHIFKHCVKGIFGDKATILITHQVEFLPQCDRVAIMNDGDCLYFGKWNKEASDILSRYLPASHMLAAAGAAEQPRDKPKAKKEESKKEEEKKEVTKAPVMQDRLTLTRAIWEFCNEARWIIFAGSLFFFLSCQCSRQVADYFIRYGGLMMSGCMHTSTCSCTPHIIHTVSGHVTRMASGTPPTAMAPRTLPCGVRSFTSWSTACACFTL